MRGSYETECGLPLFSLHFSPRRNRDAANPARIIGFTQHVLPRVKVEQLCPESLTLMNFDFTESAFSYAVETQRDFPETGLIINI
jgi:hypothetical protein